MKDESTENSKENKVPLPACESAVCKTPDVANPAIFMAGFFNGTKTT